jgi:antibiotic biosynthesis monooxygenase (ABM) superfamily enzyme
MNAKEQAVLNFGVWLTVYPSVLGTSYGIDALALELPLWLEILVSTALTVPLISYVAVPLLKILIAKAEGKAPDEMG